MGKVVTVETGLACNNRCAHCPQPPLRSLFGKIAKNLSTEDIKQRILMGLEQGADEIAFTGGEPTLRTDIGQLIRFAHDNGAKRVSVTTNGRMFSYAAFCDQMLDAGLNGVSVSLHGPDAKTHEALTCVQGSFKQAVSGIATLVKRAAQRRILIDITTITVVWPSNAAHLRDTLVLAGSLGAKLHIVQPFIVSRDTLAKSSKFLMTRQELKTAISNAVKEPLPHGGRVKPYNLPVCDFDELGDVIEHQQKRLKTVKHYADIDDRNQQVSSQFFKGFACDECDLLCPGVRIELIPDTELADFIVKDLKKALEGELIISSLDLLGVKAIDKVLAACKSQPVAKRTLLWGGVGRTRNDQIVGLSEKHGFDELVLMVRPTVRQAGGVQAWELGNIDQINSMFAHFNGSVRPALFVVVNYLLDDRTVGFDTAQVLELAKQLKASKGLRVYLAVSPRTDPAAPVLDLKQQDAIVQKSLELGGAFKTMGLEPLLVANPSAEKEPMWLRVSSHVPAVDWAPGFVKHRFAGPQFGWVMWSYPVWVREPVL